MASKNPLKKVMGLTFAQMYTAPEYTMIACSMLARYTTKISLARGSSTAEPLVPVTHAISANTPIGAKPITMAVILYMISATLSKNASAGLPFSPRSDMAIPMNSANTMSCRILSLAAALMGLVGTMLRNVSTMLGIGLGVYVPTSPIT